jgi:hypothetical protein
MKFIKAQDKLFKEQHAANVVTASVWLFPSFFLPELLVNSMQQGTFEEAEASFRSQIKVLEEDLARQKVDNTLSTYPFMMFMIFSNPGVDARLNETLPPGTRADIKLSSCFGYEDCTPTSSKSSPDRKVKFLRSGTKQSAFLV